MNHLSLAARYRPQTFSDVAGNPPAAIALSRAAREDRIAPAYLLSGTRGVGKTTIARIFAKALNCERSPAAEPCNQCSQCQHITAGNHIDVAEIDGASNTGVDDIRALRDNIGFMPMEGRYKVFIIDEAHMLSKSAFNALLKTLEEPPAHTVFIFATTEAHRFPATIISRCQHFVFRHLSEENICSHLQKILTLEQISFEEQAVRLIARRAAGSVRDGMSLLDQALAMGPGTLDAAVVRQTLGVAGPELFVRLYEAIARQDCAGIMDLTSELLSSGIDLAFFTKELISGLRNLFLLRQTGEKILPHLNLASDEEKFLKNTAPLFQTAHLHAAWQLALETQRSIAQSPMPGAALEMLIINLALLPQLLPVGSPNLAAPPQPQNFNTKKPEVAPAPPPPPAPPGQAQNFRTEETVKTYNSAATSFSWEDFRAFCRQDFPDLPDGLLRNLNISWQGSNLEIMAKSVMLWEQLQAARNMLENALARYCGQKIPTIHYKKPQVTKTREELLAEGNQKPEIKMCCQILDGELIQYSDKTNGGDPNAKYE